MRFILFIALFLLQINTAFSQKALPAQQLLDTALSKAARENKKVFAISTATWCPPCQQLKAILHDKEVATLLEKQYVLLYLYSAERGKKEKNNNPGTLEIIEKYDGYTMGVPYWFILDAAGEKLADSYNGAKRSPDMMKKYITYPDSEGLLKDFEHILERTSALTNKEIKLISERIKKIAWL